jgi:hypothetical protein
MPRNVRNWWIELDVDGKKIDINTGPRSKSGGFNINIWQRDMGAVTGSLIISGEVEGDTLTLTARTFDGNSRIKNVTRR